MVRFFFPSSFVIFFPRQLSWQMTTFYLMQIKIWIYMCSCKISIHYQNIESLKCRERLSFLLIACRQYYNMLALVVCLLICLLHKNQHIDFNAFGRISYFLTINLSLYLNTNRNLCYMHHFNFIISKPTLYRIGLKHIHVYLNNWMLVSQPKNSIMSRTPTTTNTRDFKNKFKLQ